MLRQDNADLRLTKMGYEIGLASYQRLETLNQKIKQIEVLTETAKRVKFLPDEINETLNTIGSTTIREPQTLYNILKRPELNIAQLEAQSQSIKKELLKFGHEEKQQLEINIKYENYIKKEEQMVQKIQSLDQYVLKDDFNYDRVQGLSHESREKLKMIKPRTIGQATRISGVSPSDISILSVYLGQ
jgi:tRNA uridine 5-carboxymethylaminomethyl modification enzyme